MSVYFKFLEIRDYFLETPAQQLRAMTELFGREHSDCTDIWRRLYISSDESEGDQEPIRKKWKPPGWLNKVVYHCGLDRLVDLIPYAWDDHLLDETFANLQTPRLWEHISKRYLPK
jgi:hypothetical protein